MQERLEELKQEWLEDGSETARQSVLDACLPAVTNLAKRWSSERFPLHDLIQEANIAICQALDDQRPLPPDVPLLSALLMRARSAMARYMSDYGNTIREKRYIIEARKKYKRGVPILREKMGREPTEGEICLYLKMKPAQIRNLLKNPQEKNIVNIDDVTDDDPLSGGNGQVNTVGSGDWQGSADRSLLIGQILSTMPEEPKSVLTMYCVDGLTADEISCNLNITTAKTYQLLKEAKNLFRLETARLGLSQEDFK